MKRILTALILIAMVFAGAACAETPYAQMTDEELEAAYEQITEEMLKRTIARIETEPKAGEIVFRSIPWGTSATDFISTMNQAGLSGSASANRIYSWERVNLSEGEVAYASMQDNRGFEYSVRPKEFMVAGVPVYEIKAYFTYGYDAENVYTTPEKSGLYYAYYDFKGVEDQQATADVLYEKMCAVYGDTPRMMATSSPTSRFSGYYDYAIWEGENDTAVMLMNSYYLNADGTPYTGYVWHLELCYGKANSAQLIDAVGEAVAREEREALIGDSSVDGL